MLPIEVNELEAVPWTIACTDENGQPGTPLTCSYRVDDARTGASIVPLTIVTPVAQTMRIVVPASAQSIVDTTQLFEEKVLTVITTWASGPKPVEVRYRVLNLQFQP